jgi:hypothetical protein
MADIVVDTDELALRLLSTTLQCGWASSSLISSSRSTRVAQDNSELDDEVEHSTRPLLSVDDEQTAARHRDGVQQECMPPPSPPSSTHQHAARHLSRSEEDDALQLILSTTDLLPAVGPAFRWEHLAMVLRRYLLATYEKDAGDVASGPTLPVQDILAEVKFKLLRLATQQHFFILHRRQLDSLGVGPPLPRPHDPLDVVQPLSLQPLMMPHRHSDHYVLLRRRLPANNNNSNDVDAMPNSATDDAERINARLQAAQDALFPAVLQGVGQPAPQPVSNRRSYTVLTLMASMKPVGNIPPELILAAAPNPSFGNEERPSMELNSQDAEGCAEDVGALIEDDDDDDASTPPPLSSSKDAAAPLRRRRPIVSTRILILNPMLCYGAISAQIRSMHHIEQCASSKDAAAPLRRTSCSGDAAAAAVVAPPAAVLSRPLVEMMFLRIGVHNQRPWKKFVETCPEIAALVAIPLARSAAAAAGQDITTHKRRDATVGADSVAVRPAAPLGGMLPPHPTYIGAYGAGSNAAPPPLPSSESAMRDEVRTLKQLALEILQAACRLETHLMSS